MESQVKSCWIGCSRDEFEKRFTDIFLKRLDKPLKDKELIAKNIRYLSGVFCVPHNRVGLLLQGDLGRGKTLFLKSINMLLGGSSRNCFLLDVTKLPNLVKNYPNDFETYLNAKFVLIDDIGNERQITDYGDKLSPIKDIIEYRYARGLITILTTNQDLDGLGSLYGDRVKDRLKDYIKIPFKGASYRG